MSETTTQAPGGERDPRPYVLQSPSWLDSLKGRLAHYEMREILGQGGFGIVLKAFDEKLQRLVAIKVLGPQLASNATARQRFVREARSVAAVRHENVVQVFEVEEEPVPYLVMEYVAGGTLQGWIDRDGPLEVQQIVRIGAQVAAGLAAAHEKGEVHRDIKPANILLQTEPGASASGVPQAKITDFGLARAVDDASMTPQGVIAGTPLYMSPEQARGLPVDHRSDLFSLGSVLYTLCTGKPAFQAAKALGVLKRVCQDMPQPIRECNPAIPDWLADVIAKLLAKDPGERFQTAAEVAGLLRQRLAWLEDPSLPVRSETAASFPPRRPAARKGRSLRWLVAGGVVAVLVGSLALLPSRPRPAAPDPEQASEKEPDPAPGVADLPALSRKEPGFTDPPAPPPKEAEVTRKPKPVGKKQGDSPRTAATDALELAVLTAALEKKPNQTAYEARAVWYACRGQWADSARDYLARVELDPKECLSWLAPAACLILAGQEEEYRKLCRRMLEQFSGSQDILETNVIVKVCLLLPGINLAELPVAAREKSLVQGQVPAEWLPWATSALALESYRGGDYPQARHWSSKAREASSTSRSLVLALLLQAMAEHQLHQPDEALRLLTEASALIPLPFRLLGIHNYPTGKFFLSPANVTHDWMIAEILRREAEVLLFPTLPVFLKGKYEPRDNAERLNLAVGCRIRGDRRCAAVVYADAFAADPRLADDLKAGHRYTAACCAIRGNTGAGAVPVDDPNRVHERRRALLWMRQELAVRARQGERGTPAERLEARQALQQWQREPLLVGVRNQSQLARLPADEQEEWGRFWAEVAALESKLRQMPK